MAGIGGTGVVTIGQTLAVAAHLEGLYSSNLDVTGLAQKYGAVLSHVKFAPDPAMLHATRVANGECDTLIGCDLIVSAGDDTVAKLKAGEFAALDVDALIEEIEGLAGRDRRELKSRLRVLLAHLLKRLYIDAPDDYRGWEITIREQRRQLLDLLEQSPSLRNEVELLFPKCWAEALATVREDYPQTVFPDRWPGRTDLDTLLSEKVW